SVAASRKLPGPSRPGISSWPGLGWFYRRRRLFRVGRGRFDQGTRERRGAEFVVVDQPTGDFLHLPGLGVLAWRLDDQAGKAGHRTSSGREAKPLKDHRPRLARW